MALGSPTLGAVRRRDPGLAPVGSLLGAPRVGVRPPPARRPAPPTPEERARTAQTWARGASWELRLTGQHYGGLSNAALLDVRRREGRPFDADTPALRARAVRAVMDDARASDRWSVARGERVFGDAVRDWIVGRVERGTRDVTIAPLTPAYAAWKARHYPGRPVGVARGRWLAALANRRTSFVFVTAQES